jgi:hypothetical protein
MIAPAAKPPITPAATAPPRALAAVGAATAATEIAAAAARVVRVFIMMSPLLREAKLKGDLKVIPGPAIDLTPCGPESCINIYEQ